MKQASAATQNRKIILLEHSATADWPILIELVMSHVQQAAHESPAWWGRTPCQRRVRLELAGSTAAVDSIHYTRSLVQALGARLDTELAVRSFVIARGASPQQHRLVLSGF